MRFLNLLLNYDGKTKNIKLFDKTLIYSKENSVGKSTLLRLMFYSLGYPIPGTYGLKFKKINTEILFERDGEKYIVKRNDNYIEIYKGLRFIHSCTLTGHDDSWFTYIWGIDSIRVLKNILGAIYMDQDKGWTLLNRGKVIGNIRFNVRDLLIGLSKKGNDFENELVRLDEEQKLLNKTRQLQELAKTTEEFKNSSIGELREPQDEQLNNRYKNLKLQRKVVSKKINDIKKNISNEQGLKKYLVSLNMMVEVNDKAIVINENNLLNFKDNIEFLKQKSADLQEDKEKIEYEISVVKNKLEDRVSSLFNETDVIDKTLQDISNINIDNSILDAREDELRKSISQLNERIEDKFVDSNELIDETKGWINLFADKLGVSNVVQNKKYIFTRDIKSISGTIYYKVVFSFKMAYIKTIEKYTGIILPIVLDSPSGREVTNRNITEVIEILNEYFLKNQIIIASINKYKLEGVKEIDLTTDKIFS
ncbi:hypothetical protein [Pediococcus acidilactici]|jgi:hypothetical protein|uniref:hypothetical protein n=1 Tax=Pediococcus acidilactici TaxID=1254 RepID=UPI0013124D28|nr:hypothetical protein [Pediococcus acidilactici]KAF0341325.1 hypothetical protein GBO42_03745 [Pediococcus acidilactici]KAF0352854.1 hypothetical protein GBO46_03745 [Pediococcus acidilactici]KAF0356661.1 hypothetical protein GBO48_03745 [Pediococcus acidilactici]KAF0359219.1 hypothetical protein GBO49_08020 [Pediococcus acidilactici]KAF0376732.1 hypothetical protein GBO59_03745 [Pediococcus acidilactici]